MPEEGVMSPGGKVISFSDDMVVRYLDQVIVKEEGYEVVFKAGVSVFVRV